MPDSPQHKIILGDDFNTLTLSGALIPESIFLLEAELATLLDPPKHVVVQCENLSEISKPWVRPLVLLARELEKQNKKVRMIRASHAIETFLKAEGVDSVLVIRPGLKEAMADLGVGARKALDVDFVNPFLAATVEVLKTQAKTSSIPGKIFVKKPGESFSGDISGVIGLVSDAFTGSVVISFPELTFLEIISRIFGEQHAAITPEIQDGAAELTNIIFGRAKIVLNEKGYGIKTALPSVVTGKNHSVKSAVLGHVVVVPFESDAGPFFIEITTAV